MTYAIFANLILELFDLHHHLQYDIKELLQLW
jgi:hypothetical protein